MRVQEVHEYQTDYYDEPGEYEDWFSSVEAGAGAPLLHYSFDVKKNMNYIQWVRKDAGRQLLSGSFHPVNDENWYDNVKLEPGVHKFVRIVLEGFDYPENVSTQEQLDSSMLVRKAILSIVFRDKLDKSGQQMNAYGRKYLENNSVWRAGSRIRTKPTWWDSRIVLVSAATVQQVKDLQLELECATTKIYETLSFEEFDISVGSNHGHLVSYAQAMAQPALVRCSYCTAELLVVNRCVCQQVSYCNQSCRQAGWAQGHQKECTAAASLVGDAQDGVGRIQLELEELDFDQETK